MKIKSVFTCLLLISVLVLLTACGSKPAAEPEATEVAEVTEKVDTPQDEDTSPDTAIDYYSLCTNQDAKTVEGFASEIRQQILDKNWEGLADNVSFPINVDDSTFNNKDEFVAADWDSILNEAFYKAIEGESCKNLFCNSDGIMMGNGQVWFAELLSDSLESQGLKVISINP